LITARPQPNGVSGSRHDRLSHHATPGPNNSLFPWPEAKSPLRIAFNYAVILVCRISPSLRLKNWLLSKLAITVG
jgi:hypothetical protein